MVNKAKVKGSRWEHDLVELLKEKVIGIKVKRIAGSGAIGTSLNEPLLQGDVVAKFSGFPKPFRIECKTGYGGDSQLTVKRDWINKIRCESESSNSFPALACKFSGARKSDGTQMFVVLDINDFIFLMNYVDDLKDSLDQEFIKNAKHSLEKPI